MTETSYEFRPGTYDPVKQIDLIPEMESVYQNVERSEQEYFDDYTIPFVKKSKIKIACRYESEYDIKENGCVMIIGKIEMIAVDDSGLGEDLWINHEKLNSIGIGGLDTYYSVKCMDRLTYAQSHQDSKSIYGTQKTSS